MLDRSARWVLYSSLLILIIRVVFELQHIQGDRYSFLHEVKVVIQFDSLSYQEKCKVERVTLDHKVVELADKQIDSVQSTVSYLGSPRIAFTKSIFLRTDSLRPEQIKGVIVHIGTTKIQYNSAQFKEQWVASRENKGEIKWQMPTLPSSRRSALPLLSSVINWRGDDVVLKYIAQHNLGLMIAIGLFWIAVRRKHFIEKQILEKRSPLPLACLFLLLGLFKQTLAIWPLEANLDPSFVAGLSWARALGLQWGKDLIFTYGPYFWLTMPSIVMSSRDLLVAFSLTLILTSFSLAVIYKTIWANYLTRSVSYITLVWTSIILFFYHYDLLDYLVVAILMLTYQHIAKPLRQKVPPAIGYAQLITLLLALLSLIKFSYVAFSLSLLILLSLGLGFYKLWRPLLSIWVSYGLFLIVLWMISGQKAENLLAYLGNGFEIAGGYTEAMAKPLWNPNVGLSINLISMILLLIALGVLGCLVGATFLGATSVNVLFFSLLTSPMLFLAFKEGFVRFDTPHMTLYYSQLLLIAVALLMVKTANGFRLTTLSSKLVIVSIGVSCCLAPLNHFDNLKDISLVLSSEKRVLLLDEQKDRIMKEFEIDEMDAELLNRANGVDVVPTNIALLHALNVNWKPRPIFQSYSVYTPKLSQANAAFYLGGGAPDYVFMNYASIDNRYPLFDEPGLILSLLRNYYVQSNYADSYLLLKRLPKSRIFNKLVVSPQSYVLGNELIIPKQLNKLTFMNVEIKLTLLGKLMSLFYKIPPLSVRFVTSEGTFSHRVIRQTLAEGVYVSDYVSGLGELEALLNRKISSSAMKIAIDGNSWFYKDLTEMEFWTW